MGKTNNHLGKAVANHFGYTVRMMVNTKTDDKTKRTIKLPNGKFGIYAGKNKLDEVSSVGDAVTKINKIVSDKTLTKK